MLCHTMLFLILALEALKKISGDTGIVTEEERILEGNKYFS